MTVMPLVLYTQVPLLIYYTWNIFYFLLFHIFSSFVIISNFEHHKNIYLSKSTCKTGSNLKSFQIAYVFPVVLFWFVFSLFYSAFN